MSPTTLRRIFLDERAKFAKTFPQTADCGLVLRARHFIPAHKRKDRDFAWYDYDTQCVYIVRAALEQSEGCIRGIIRHELGHAVDDSPVRKGAERRADRLARRATGAPIRYTADGLQHATHGRPGRPAWLPQ
jgi:hypothetical protein